MAKTTVVNRYHVTVDWESDPQYVYIGRPKGHRDPLRCSPNQSGYFGNRHNVGLCMNCGEVHVQGAAVAAYKKDFYSRIASDPVFAQAIEALRGKILVCFCKPKLCHGDVIVEYLESHVKGGE